MSYWHYRRGAASVRVLVEFARAQGVDAASLLQNSGLTEPALDDPNLEIAAAQELRVIARLLRLKPALAGAGRELGLHYHFSSYGLWGYGLISSATLGDALTLALRYIALTYAFTGISLHEEAALAVLRFDEPDLEPALRRFVTERDLAAAALLVRELVGPELQVRRWRLRTRRPRERESLPTLFGAPASYGAETDEFAIDRQWLAQPLPQANPITAALCEQLCAALLERRRVRGQTANLVQQMLDMPQRQLPDLPTMARLLNTSERTLKRRLHAENRSFRELVAERRRSLAAELLADSRLSLTEIAARLDFADVSSFSQAYKRWHGCAPSAARARLRRP